MFKCRRIPVCLLLVSAFLFAAGASARAKSVMSENKVPGQVESKARRLMHDLKGGLRGQPAVLQGLAD